MIVSPFVDWPANLVLVLASRSPRRAELLAVAGIPFEIQPAGDVEFALAQELAARDTKPEDYAIALAEAKARSVYETGPHRLVLGSDTVVVLDGNILEKPTDEADAYELLSRLSDRQHTVVSAISLLGGPAGNTCKSAYEKTEVNFMPLLPEKIKKYIATGEPMDKAGAYGIQGYGAMMVSRVDGCYFNVMGLPLARLGVLLREVLDPNFLPGELV